MVALSVLTLLVPTLKKTRVSLCTKALVVLLVSTLTVPAHHLLKLFLSLSYAAPKKPPHISVRCTALLPIDVFVMATFHKAPCVVPVTFPYVQKDRKSLAHVMKVKTLTRSVTLNELLTLKLSAKWIVLKTATPLCKKHACTMLIKP